MDWEKVMNIYNSCWFETEILKKQSNLLHSSNFDKDPDREIEIKQSKTEISRIPSIHHGRSISCDMSSKTSLDSLSLSPDSVLLLPNKLQAILSGKESTEEAESESEQKQELIFQENISRRKDENTKKRRRKKKGGESKSLSDLEFEELKGFMDLGFVFTEEDRNSSLAEIVPGLQRLGKRKDDDKTMSSTVSRPYLSEAWEVLERRKEEENEKPILMNWRIPALSNEIDMKDTLRWWAHTVASAVK